MGFTPEALSFNGGWTELALRFVACEHRLHCALFGGLNLEHMLENIAIIEPGPLPDSVVESIRQAWHRCDDGSWIGQTQL